MNIFECLLADTMNDEFKAQLCSDEDELFNVDLKRFDRNSETEREPNGGNMYMRVQCVCVWLMLQHPGSSL